MIRVKGIRREVIRSLISSACRTFFDNGVLTMSHDTIQICVSRYDFMSYSSPSSMVPSVFYDS